MEKITVKNFGPIKEANLTLGDLTILVGPQASGKSLFLELFKLIKDRKHIISTLKKYNYILKKNSADSVIDLYFGEGMNTLFSPDTEITVSSERFSETSIINAITTPSITTESVFYIPAQRILSIDDGRPRNFMEFDMSTPYILRHFSETLRIFLQGGLGNPDIIFPMKARLKGGVKKSIDESIFHGGKVVLDSTSNQRKMKLDVNGLRLPFMRWSAGQKEFMPLLLAIYCLSGPKTSVVNKEDYKWVTIEEPEMGLHPRAIESVILEIVELMQSGYKVLLSTHSSVFLDFAWVMSLLHNITSENFKDALTKLFGINPTSSASNIFDGLNDKTIKTYFFRPQSEGVITEDISSLDVMDNERATSEWGGISGFSSRASEIVSEYIGS